MMYLYYIMHHKALTVFLKRIKGHKAKGGHKYGDIKNSIRGEL